MVPPTKRWLVAAAVVLAAAGGCSTVTAGSPSSSDGGGSSSAGGGATADGDAAGSAGGSSSGSACGPESGFCVTVEITGATTVQGSTQKLVLSSCADYAKGGSVSGGQLPGLLGDEIGGHEITAANEIRDYAGPGTYDTESLKSVAGVLDVDVDGTPYQAADDTTAQAVINADGSGSFTFADLKEGEQGNPTTAKGTISGSFTWTCTD